MLPGAVAAADAARKARAAAEAMVVDGAVVEEGEREGAAPDARG